jgi:hypothetical protein
MRKKGLNAVALYPDAKWPISAPIVLGHLSAEEPGFGHWKPHRGVDYWVLPLKVCFI